MEIQHKENGTKGSFYIEVDGQMAGEMTYVWSGEDKIIIDHTEVSEVLKGKSAGKQLLSKLVDWAREKHIKVLPLCPFAKAVFDKTPEYADVLF